MDLTAILMLLLVAALGAGTDTITAQSATGFWPISTSLVPVWTNSSSVQSSGTGELGTGGIITSPSSRISSSIPSTDTLSDRATSLSSTASDSASSRSSSDALGAGATLPSFTASNTASSSSDILGAGATTSSFTASSPVSNLPMSETTSASIFPDTGSASSPITTASASTSSENGWSISPCSTTTTIVPALTTTDGVTILNSALPSPVFPDSCMPIFWFGTFTTELDRIVPPIERWIQKHKDGEGSDHDDDIGPPIILHFENLITSISNILPKIPKPPRAGGGCVASISNLFSCLNDVIPKIKIDIEGTDIDDIEINFPKLKTLIKGLKENDNDPKSSSSSSSSEGCTKSSTSVEYTTCSSSQVTVGTLTTLTEACETSTKTATGCSIAITGSATTLPWFGPSSCTESSTSQAEYVTCSPSPVISGTLTTTTEVCQTSTTTVSGCSIAVTGSSTTLSSSSASEVICAGDSNGPCAACATPAANTLLFENNTLPLIQRTLDTEEDIRNFHVDNPFGWSDGIDSYMMIRAVDPLQYKTTKIKQLTGQVTAFYQPFIPSQGPFELMLDDLYGCTSLVIISHLGVYMNHIWEGPTFKSYPPGSPTTFDRDVLDHIPNGNPNPDAHLPALLPLLAQGQIFGTEDSATWSGLEGGNIVQSLIITPGTSEILKYPAQIERLKQAVQGWLPSDEPQLITYDSEYNNMARVNFNMANTALGKVLIQYDPMEDVDQVTNEEGQQCDLVTSAIRVFVGQNPVSEYYDIWGTPTTGPFIESGGGARRDLCDAPACRLVHSTSTAVADSTSISTTLSTSPSSSPSSSISGYVATLTTALSSTALNSFRSISSESSNRLTLSGTTSPSDGPWPTTWDSFSFAPTTSPTALSSCEITTVSPSTFCTCDGAWSADLTTTTFSDGVIYTLCTTGSVTVPVGTVLPTPTTLVTSTSSSPPPEPSPTLEYSPGQCKVHIFEASKRDWDYVISSLEVSDAVGKVLYDTGRVKLKWEGQFTAYAADTKLPWNIDVRPGNDPASLPDKHSNVNVPSNEKAYIPRVRRSYSKLVIMIVAGASNWTSDQRDVTVLPHCRVGGWDSGNLFDSIDWAFGNGATTRDMDCFFEC